MDTLPLTTTESPKDEKIDKEPKADAEAAAGEDGSKNGQVAAASDGLAAASKDMEPEVSADPEDAKDEANAFDSVKQAWLEASEQCDKILQDTEATDKESRTRVAMRSLREVLDHFVVTFDPDVPQSRSLAKEVLWDQQASEACKVDPLVKNWKLRRQLFADRYLKAEEEWKPWDWKDLKQEEVSEYEDPEGEIEEDMEDDIAETLKDDGEGVQEEEEEEEEEEEGEGLEDDAPADDDDDDTPKGLRSKDFVSPTMQRRIKGRGAEPKAKAKAKTKPGRKQTAAAKAKAKAKSAPKSKARPSKKTLKAKEDEDQEEDNEKATGSDEKPKRRRVSTAKPTEAAETGKKKKTEKAAETGKKKKTEEAETGKRKKIQAANAPAAGKGKKKTDEVDAAAAKKKKRLSTASSAYHKAKAAAAAEGLDEDAQKKAGREAACFCDVREGEG